MSNLYGSCLDALILLLLMNTSNMVTCLKAERDLVLEGSHKKFRAMSLLTSIAGDFDVISDWLYYRAGKQEKMAPDNLLRTQLFFCYMGVFTWLLLASDGRLLRPILKCFKIPSFSTGFLLVLNIVLEDIPQRLLLETLR